MELKEGLLKRRSGAVVSVGESSFITFKCTRTCIEYWRKEVKTCLLLSFLSSSHRLILPPDYHSIQNRNADLFSCILRHCTTCGMFLIMRVPPPRLRPQPQAAVNLQHELPLLSCVADGFLKAFLLCYMTGLMCAHSNHPQHCCRIKQSMTELECLESSSSAFPHACNVCVKVAPPVCSFTSWICVLRHTTGRVEHKLPTQVIPQSCSRILHVLSWRSTSRAEHKEIWS